VKTILKAAAMEGDEEGRAWIGVGHLLAGLVREQGGVACRAIVAAGGRPAEILSRIPPDDLPDEGARLRSPASPRPRQRFTFGTCCTDLLHRTEDPVVRRESEIARLRTVLARRRHGNAVVVGEPGVGKTAVVHGLITGMGQVFELDVPLLLAGTENRGDLEYRMHHIAEEALRWNRVLFIDDLHFLANGVLGEDGEVVRFCLRRTLERVGGLVGSLSTEGYDLFRRVDPAFLDCFQPVWVEAATEEQAIDIVIALKGNYLSSDLPDALVPTLVELARLYMPQRALPGSAVDLLDELGAAVPEEEPIDEAALIRVTSIATEIPEETIRRRAPGRSPWVVGDESPA
jgi:ATP-dependent Clp protease ATP-binding subunit ClpC